MTVTTAMPAMLPGDICPAWCGGEHRAHRDRHPDDHVVEHRSPEIDCWRAEGAVEEDIRVTLSGYRFDSGETQRFADVVQARGETFPGFEGGGVELALPDARRLANALALACALLEGQA
jgi:hypothetical protein